MNPLPNSVTAAPLLMTVAEFEKLPEKPGVVRELHHGEVFELSYPWYGHWKTQQHLVSLLAPLADKGDIGAVLPFRPLPEYEFWFADVAFVSQERVDEIDPDSNLFGSPNLVIEVESPWNTAAEFDDREAVCLSSGCQEFWVVYPRSKRISVTTAQGTRKYTIGDTV